MLYDYGFCFMLDKELTNNEMAKIEHDVLLSLNDLGYDVDFCYCHRVTVENEDENA